MSEIFLFSDTLRKRNENHTRLQSSKINELPGNDLGKSMHYFILLFEMLFGVQKYTSNQ